MLLAVFLVVSTLIAQDADPKILAKIDQLEKAERYAEAIPLAEDQLAIFETSLRGGFPARLRARVAELYIAVGLFARAEMLLRGDLILG